MRLIISIVAALAAGHGCYAASRASHVLWYESPATTDFTSALMIGNGRLGAMLHGYTDQELITLNEDSIWSGGPIDRVNPNALPNLPLIREQLANGSLAAASTTWEQNFAGVPTVKMRTYQPAGELRIDFPHAFANSSGYRHELDIDAAEVKLTYTHGGVNYTRQAFGNYAAGVLAFRLTASTPNALSFDISLTRQQNVTAQSVDAKDRRMTLSGHGSLDDYYKFASQARLVVNGCGKVQSNSTALMVSGATDVWILYGVESSFYSPGQSLESAVESRLEAAVAKGGPGLQTEAKADYQQYYHRSSLNLGDSGDNGLLNTPTRMDRWKRGNNITDDPELLTLAFNMGKYMLIQSSRPGTMPANLQGVWNRDFAPAWDSKFTININLEMNYWLAQPLNLPEISEPVYDLLDRMRVRGADVAKRMYGAKGFTCHHNTDITADCVPYSFRTIDSPFPLGAAWLAMEAIEHFRFSLDAEFAKTRALPILREAIEFIYSFAIKESTGKWWVTSPSCSPENSYNFPGGDTGLDGEGVLGDRAIMWEVMTGYIELLRATGGAAKDIERAEAFRVEIQPPETGSFGQMLEWSSEFEEQHPDHRHFTPFIGLQPGSWISPLRNESATEAARVLLKHRMDSGAGGTSWSVVWAIILHARLFDAERALKLSIEYISNWVFPNLMSRNGKYFQIDANSGITISVLEMLLQSHAGVVHLGPAIPKTGLSKGSFKGWLARGGFTIDMAWEGGKVTRATIKSSKGSPLEIRVQEGRAFKVNGQVQSGAMLTQPGASYEITVE